MCLNCHRYDRAKEERRFGRQCDSLPWENVYDVQLVGFNKSTLDMLKGTPMSGLNVSDMCGISLVLRTQVTSSTQAGPLVITQGHYSVHHGLSVRHH